MSKSLFSRLKSACGWWPVALLSVAAQGQTLNYAPDNAVNTTSTFTDLGTAGTAIATANTDDANSAAQPIGFSFSFNNSTFTQFVLNTNGLIRLGANAPSVANLFLSQDGSATQTAIDPTTSPNPADVNLLMPFNADLVAGSGAAEYRVVTTGTGTAHVCTIQWKNVSDKTGQGTDTSPTQYTNFTFQLRLYEGSNAIEFVYGPATASTNAAISRFPTVGIKGSTYYTAVLGYKPSGAALWSTTTFIYGPYFDATHNFRNAALPDAGRTYRFVPSTNDAMVTALYTLGTASSAYGSPAPVQALISNAGSTTQTNLPVTLTVNGATTYTSTQTIPTLAPGASVAVNFTYPVSVAGSNNVNSVAITVPADDAASNNSQTANQTVSTVNLSYSAGNTFVGGAGVGVAGSVIAVGYQTARAASVNAVTTTFADAGTAGSMYQAVIYAAAANGQPGTMLYTSPARPRPIIAAGKLQIDSVPIPNVVVNGAFFVGIKSIGSDNISIAYQLEIPLRPGTFFYTLDGSAWTDINTSALNSRLAIDVAFSTVTATHNAIAGSPLSIYPNPAHRSFTLTVPAVPGARTATTVLLNSLGQQIQTRSLNLETSGTRTQIDVSTLAPGLYTLRVQAGDQTASQSVIIE